MQTIVLTKGDAGPTLEFTIKQNGVAVDLSGASTVATFYMGKPGVTANTYTVTCTGLNSSGRCRVPFTALSLATAGQYEGEIYITGLGGGAQTSEQFILAVRPSRH